MNRIVMVLVVAAMTCYSTSAFAIHEGEGKVSSGMMDIAIGGSVDIRSRDFQTLSLDKDNTGANATPYADNMDTQERIRLEVNAKAGDVKGKVTLENDWDAWGRFEKPQANGATAPAWTVSSSPTGSVGDKTQGRLEVREAWILFPVPDTPVSVKGGHMLLQLGQGWWFRSMKYGSDAWVAFMDMDKLHLGVVDVKISEGKSYSSDDIDAYVLVGTIKASETMKFGADITYANDRKNGLGFGTPGAIANNAPETQAYNVGLNFDGKAGPVGLKAEVDVQTGKAKLNDAKFKGNQVVVQGNVPVEPVTINFTVARGSGSKYDTTTQTFESDYKQYVNFLDADQHYTFLYEYKVAGACGDVHQGFCNTTALSAGVMANVTKSVAVGADVWYLQATEKMPKFDDATASSSDLGTEIDARVNWALYDNLSWNWTFGYFKPGDALGKDTAVGAQGVLSLKF